MIFNVRFVPLVPLVCLLPHPSSLFTLHFFPIVGKGEHLGVAVAVTVGIEGVGVAMGLCLKEAIDFLGAVAVLAKETSCQATIWANLGLGAKETHTICLCPQREEGLHPLAHAGTHHIYRSTVAEMFAKLLYDGLVGDALMFTECETPAQLLKALYAHALEEEREDTLLRLPVRKEAEQHHHDERRVEQKAQQETQVSTGIAYEQQKGVARGERTVKIKDSNRFHN